MHDEWPEYIDDAAEVAIATPRTDLASRWNQLSLISALEHLSQRREQVRTLRRRAAIFAALALVEGGILLGLLLKYLSG
jgi:ABC-type sulfate transport system substrate-binding protein